MKKPLLLVRIVWFGIIVVTGLLIFYLFQDPANHPSVHNAENNTVTNTPTLNARIFSETKETRKLIANDNHPMSAAIDSDSNTIISTSKTPDIVTSTTTQPMEFFKVITNPQLGQYAVVNSDGTSVVLKDKQDNVVWSTNLMMAAKASKAHILGGTKIYSMRLVGNELLVRVGKADFLIDIKTGNITGSGSD
jgi:hypothetical protein